MRNWALKAVIPESKYSKKREIAKERRDWSQQRHTSEIQRKHALMARRADNPSPIAKGVARRPIMQGVVGVEGEGVLKSEESL
ncbi:hypothetical protein SUGI_0590570 [Cryptomeria japonica]|nr:hypothetical protein SUGI_0590570 [Cryptomeria japonica]